MVKFTHIVIDPGPVVLCDMCNADFTDDDTTKGGFLFGSKAVCPHCAPSMLETIKRCGEEHFIGERCAPDETFRAFVYRIREAGNVQPKS